MDKQNVLRIPYAIPATNKAAMVLVSSAIPVLFAYLAWTNHSRLSLFRLVTLSPSGATNFYWVLMCVSLLAASVAVLMSFFRLKELGYIELAENSVFLPQASLRGKMISIPYRAIQSVRLMDVHGTRIFIVKSSVGESRLVAMGFSSEVAFADVCKRIHDRAGKL
jgi:hypothetical protein